MSKQVGKNSQHSTDRNSDTMKTNSEWLHYLDMNSFQLAPSNSESRKRVFMELYIWANENDRAYTVKQFFKMKRMDPFCIYRWLDEDPIYQTMYKATISALASRREVKGLERELDPGLVRISMPLYCDEWKKLEEWRAKLSEKTESGGTKIVVIEKYGEEK